MHQLRLHWGHWLTVGHFLVLAQNMLNWLLGKRPRLGVMGRERSLLVLLLLINLLLLFIAQHVFQVVPAHARG